MAYFVFNDVYSKQIWYILYPQKRHLTAIPSFHPMPEMHAHPPSYELVNGEGSLH